MYVQTNVFAWFMKRSEHSMWINLDLTLNELFIFRWFTLLIAYNNTMESLMKEAHTKTKTTETKQTNVRMTNSPKNQNIGQKMSEKIRINQSLSAISRVNYGFFCIGPKVSKGKTFQTLFVFQKGICRAFVFLFFWITEDVKSWKTKDWINELERELNFYLKSDAGADAFVISSWSFDCSISICLPFVHTKYIYYHCHANPPHSLEYPFKW